MGRTGVRWQTRMLARIRRAYTHRTDSKGEFPLSLELLYWLHLPASPETGTRVFLYNCIQFQPSSAFTIYGQYSQVTIAKYTFDRFDTVGIFCFWCVSCRRVVFDDLIHSYAGDTRKATETSIQHQRQQQYVFICVTVLLQFRVSEASLLFSVLLLLSSKAMRFMCRAAVGKAEQSRGSVHTMHSHSGSSSSTSGRKMVPGVCCTRTKYEVRSTSKYKIHTGCEVLRTALR